MKTAKEFRLSFYQWIRDDPDELTPCDDELCIAGISNNTIEYFANVAEAEFELVLEDYSIDIEGLKAEIKHRDNQIKLLSGKLEEALKNVGAIPNREGNPNP